MSADPSSRASHRSYGLKDGFTSALPPSILLREFAASVAKSVRSNSREMSMMCPASRYLASAALEQLKSVRTSSRRRDAPGVRRIPMHGHILCTSA